MSFINFCRKFNLSLPTVLIVLLSIVSIVFGAVNSSAQAFRGEKNREEKFSAADLPSERTFGDAEENGRFNFFSNNSKTLFDADTNQTYLKAPRNQAQKIADSPVFAEFDAWVNSFVANNFTADEEQMRRGENLAAQRRQLLKKLIELDPRAALGKAVSAEILDRLPAPVAENSEKHIGAYGDFLVYSCDENNFRTGELSGAHNERKIVLGEARYRAFVYGRREAMTTKFDIPLQGIAIDDAAAVDENFARQLETKEYESGAVDSGKPGIHGVAAELGGKTAYFSNQTELENFVAEEIRWEAKIGPARPPTNSENDALASEQLNPAWTTGAKTVLFIRVDFPDRTGEPTDFENRTLDSARAENLINNEVNAFYDKNSYGKTSLRATVTPVVRMPNTQSYYAQLNDDEVMKTDARNAARQKGFETNNFDLDIVGFSASYSFPFAGRSLTGAKGILMNGAFYLSEVAHEIGHNYGLMHANLWRTNDGSIIGAGEDKEYFDCYDTMAATVYCRIDANSHFNARYKLLLNWLTDSEAQTITSNGTYTLYPQDLYPQDSSSSRVRLLKIPINSAKNYWVEFRQSRTDNQYAMNGALIRWDYPDENSRQTELLDMNPATATVDDAPLTVGNQFYDSDNGIIIRVKEKGTAPASLKIEVLLGQNKICNFSLSPADVGVSALSGTGGTNVVVGSACAWTATSNASWLSVTDGSGGTGNGNVSFSASRNTGGERIGTITIAGISGGSRVEKTFTVTQYAGDCGYSVSPSPFPTVSAGGGTLNYTVNAASVCSALTAMSNSSWIEVNNGSITVLPNTSGGARTGEVRLTGEDALNNSLVSISVLINQSADQTTNCSFSLSAPSASLAAGNVTGSVSVVSGSGCSWTAVSNAAWITVTGGSAGSANGTVSFSVEANTSAARTGTIIIGGQTFTVTQAAVKSRKRVRFI